MAVTRSAESYTPHGYWSRRLTEAQQLERTEAAARTHIHDDHTCRWIHVPSSRMARAYGVRFNMETGTFTCLCEAANCYTHNCRHVRIAQAFVLHDEQRKASAA